MKCVFLPACAAVFALGLLAAPALAQDSVAGSWDLTLETPQGANSVGAVLKVDGDKVTGDLSSPLGAVPLTGTVNGATTDFTANIDAQGMTLPLQFHGTLAGETFNGTVKVGDFGEFPFTGKRAPAAAAAPASGAAAPAAPAAPAAAPAASNGSGIGGKWAIVLSIEGLGDVPAMAEFKQEGTVITGTIAAATGDSVPLKGTFEGNQLKIDFVAQTPQGPVPIAITGELGAAGLTGKASLAGMAEATWKGTRQ